MLADDCGNQVAKVDRVGPQDVVPFFAGHALVTCDFPLAHAFYEFRENNTTIKRFGPALVLPPTRSAAFVESLGQ